MIRRCLSALALTLPAVASAVTPVTPQLAPASRDALAQRLAAVAFPETGRNSVFIALGQALGMQAVRKTHRYEPPYLHLPIVVVDVTPASDRCAQVTLVATFRVGTPYGPTRLHGRYCLAGPGQWQAVEQEVVHDPP